MREKRNYKSLKHSSITTEERHPLPPQYKRKRCQGIATIYLVVHKIWPDSKPSQNDACGIVMTMSDARGTKCVRCRLCSEFLPDATFELGDLSFTGVCAASPDVDVPKGRFALVQSRSCGLVQLEVRRHAAVKETHRNRRLLCR